uniref:ShKT domain-containing protein n=1 Tax=Angiostrongylus cantonensis TaxID=6313 RepID=A0A0K0D1N4_ANGCA
MFFVPMLATDDGESSHRERLLHTTENAPVLINYALPHPLTSHPSSTHLFSPQPPAPEPSPPAFSPYYFITTSFPEQNALGVMPPAPHNSNILPKAIDFLDPLEETEQFSPGGVPNPPGHRPFDNGCANNAKTETSNGIRNKFFVLEDFETTTRNSPSMKSYMQVGMVPYSEQIGVSDTTSSRGFDEATISGAARFEQARDYSSRCCEWSLNGLCDRHWQRVRKMCPKSCGSLVCEDNEGVKSCTRIVDVDIEDCFQAARLTRHVPLFEGALEHNIYSDIVSILFM